MGTLQDEGQRRTSLSSAEVGNMAKTVKSGKPEKSNEAPKRRGCYACGKEGHISRHCKYMKKAKKLAEHKSDNESESESEFESDDDRKKKKKHRKKNTEYATMAVF